MRFKPTALIKRKQAGGRGAVLLFCFFLSGLLLLPVNQVPRDCCMRAADIQLEIVLPPLKVVRGMALPIIFQEFPVKVCKDLCGHPFLFAEIVFLRVRAHVHFSPCFEFNVVR